MECPSCHSFNPEGSIICGLCSLPLSRPERPAPAELALDGPMVGPSYTLAAPQNEEMKQYARQASLFLALTLLLRVVGRREAGGLGLTDLLMVLLVVDAASEGLTGESSTLGDSAVLVLTVLGWSVIVDAICYRWPRVGRIFKARPRALVTDGALDRRVMRRELMNDDELQSQLRLHGIEDMDNIAHAYIEPNGMVSIVLDRPSESPARSDAPKHPHL